MLKKISFAIYIILKFINNIIKIIFKKNFLLWFYTFLQNDAYKIKNIKGKNISFFCPNHLTLFRIETFYSKEPETISWIESFRKQKNKKIIFWDIGANIGVYSIYSSIFHKNKIEITSFEPSVNNLRVLSRNISINKLLNNISINQLPISDREGEYIQFVENSFNEGAAFHNLNLSKKRNKYNQNKSTYKIYSTNLNNLAKQKNFKYPNYIKIDIDGNEKFLLDGAKKIFNNSKLKSVLIELDERNKNFKYIKNFFKKNKFKLISKNKPPLFISKKENIKNFIFERN